MTDPTDAPIAQSQTFTGTPDDWWREAVPVTEQEAAERLLGSWYIVADTRNGEMTGSYRVSQTTRAANEGRASALRTKLRRVPTAADQTAPFVRRLIFIPITVPDWMNADLVIADSSAGSSERVPWRRVSTKWLQVFDAQRSASDATMADLNPVIASITEGP